MNEEEMKKLITRVTESVMAEVNQAELQRSMSVSELSVRAKELGGGNLNQAWKVTYDTNGFTDVGKISDNIQAWKISYDTSGIV